MIRLAVLRAVGFLTGFAAVFALLYVTLVRGDPTDVGPIRPLESTADPAAALIAEHGCWTQDAPTDVAMPGHVVVTVDGRATYGGPRMVTAALDQVFNGVDHGLVVNAFCR